MAFRIGAIHAMQSYNYIANLRAVYADFLSLSFYFSPFAFTSLCPNTDFLFWWLRWPFFGPISQCVCCCVECTWTNRIQMECATLKQFALHAYYVYLRAFLCVGLSLCVRAFCGFSWCDFSHAIAFILFVVFYTLNSFYARPYGWSIITKLTKH